MLGQLLGPGPRLPLFEEPLGQHNSSYGYSAFARGLGPEEEVLVLPQAALKVHGTALVAPGPGGAPGHTPGTPVGIVEDYSDIHYHADISDMAGTSWHEFACLNMKRLLILSMTKKSKVVWISLELY